ncbi:MAG: PAS-domain containing protein [Pseudomonadota bacterium]
MMQYGFRRVAAGAAACASLYAGAHASSGVNAVFIDKIDPMIAAAGAAVALAVAAMIWAYRVSASTRNQSLHWSDKLAEMEARLEKADAVLSAHPGLVLVWEDDNDAIETGWGDPKILGGPAALASLLSFSKDTADAIAKPVDALLNALGDLPVEDDDISQARPLRERVLELRAHGVAFSGAVITPDGRSIEIDGRVAGGQVALWMTDPAVRMAEDGAIVGTIRERATDLHGSHALLENAPFPAWRRNADRSLVWVNRAYVRMVEATSAADVIRQQLELDPSVRNIAREASDNRKMSEAPVVINANGERRVLRIVETPLHGSGDAALGGVAIDTTDLDKAKTDLRHHIEANQRTLDQIPTAVAIFGAGQNLIYHNKAFQDIWELDDAALAGRIYHGEILDELRLAGKLPEPADFDAWKETQLALYTEEIAPGGSARDGGAPDEIWHLPDGRALRIGKERHPLGGVVIAIDDITETIALEAKFNTQINVQKATLNSLGEGVAVFGADGALRLYNEAFESLWRFDPKRLENRPHVDEITGQILKKTLQADEKVALIRKVSTSKSPEDRQPHAAIELNLRNGHTVSAGAEPLPDGATLLYFLDITDSREREKELKERNAILEDADRLKSKFVDHVSYQLRTPLSAIIGFSEMLDGQMFGVLNDRQKDYVASVLSASYHLRDLINDIIDLAAIDAGKLEIARKPTDIRALLENAATFSALKAEDSQVALKVDCPKDIGEAMLDERRVKQTLFNLLSNAFSYTGAGGEVTLGARRENGVIKLWVHDTGRGVSPEDQAKVFDAFESRGPSAGAGLGLSLVDRFVRLHGGWTRLESNEGDGAVVTCFLPEAEMLRETEPSSLAPQSKNPGRIEKAPPKPAAKRPRRRKKTKKTARLDHAGAQAAE